MVVSLLAHFKSVGIHSNFTACETVGRERPRIDPWYHMTIARTHEGTTAREKRKDEKRGLNTSTDKENRRKLRINEIEENEEALSIK